MSNTNTNLKYAYDYCQNKVANSGSNFYYSFMFLPFEKRIAITAIYAFCREVDDIVDECSDPSIAATKLQWWSTEIDRVFNAIPQHPIGIALANAVQNFKLQRLWFDEIIQGMTMDLDYQGYQTFDDLKLYCHCVASTVGMLAASIFGFSNPNTLVFAQKLGIAFQLVNIIRDIGEDARRNRIYIPETYLLEFKIAPQEILQRNINNSQQFNDLIHKLANLARCYYDAALIELAPEDRALQRSAIIMAKIYFCILTEIERQPLLLLNHKISITPLRKLWIAWRTWRHEKKLCLQLQKQ